MRRLTLLGFLIVVFSGTAAANPMQDNGFSAATPPPDVDLVVVREKAYGAGGVDLSAYGLGTPDYVQSIYFRLFADTKTSPAHSYIARVTLSEGVEILGFITGESELGGESNDGVATGTDAIFGIASNPDDYSESGRGLDSGGTDGRSEFVGQTSARTFVFGLNITGGVDDFRVIIDYGDSFPADHSFDIEAYPFGSLGGAEPLDGIRIGNDSDPTVLGSGDFGEWQGLLAIPLTANVTPTQGEAIPFDLPANIFVARDPGSNAAVDSIDIVLSLPASNLFRGSDISVPVGIANGFDDHLYLVGSNGGFARFAPSTGDVLVQEIADLSGSSTDITALVGHPELFVSRDTSGDTFVDRLDRDTFTYTESIAISSTELGKPVAITGGADGLLYVVGSTTGFVSVDPETSDVKLIGLAPPTGSYTSLTGRPFFEKLYLVRDTSTDTQIDVHDIATGVTTYGFSGFPIPGAPVGITNGPGDRLYVIGKGSSGPATLAVVDPDSGTVERTIEYFDFAGSNVEICNFIRDPLFCDGFEDQACVQ